MPQWKTGQYERKDESQENRLKYPASMLEVVSWLEQNNKALDIWYVTNDLANVFFSSSVRKEDQICSDLCGIDNIHSQFCLKAMLPLLRSVII